jgi:hypothetical protein
LTGLRSSGDNVVLCLSEKMEDKSLEALIKVIGLDTRFPKECAAWERRRTEVMGDFRGTFAERQIAMHAKIERDLEDISVKIQEAVIIEVLKAFP